MQEYDQCCRAKGQTYCRRSKAVSIPRLGISSPPFASTDPNVALHRGWSVNSEASFLEMMMERMAPGARCSVIVPDGVLFRRDRTFRCIRERLLLDFTVKAVFRLPSGIVPGLPGLYVSILTFEHSATEEAITRYYEVPPLPKGSGSRRAPAPDLLDDAIAWVLKGKRSLYSWEVRAEDIIHDDYNLDLRWPGGYADSTPANANATSSQTTLFAESHFEYETSERLEAWVEERGKRSGHIPPERLLGVSKHGLVSPRGAPPADTHRCRRVRSGDSAQSRLDTPAAPLRGSGENRGSVPDD
jgi:hypothetical protein